MKKLILTLSLASLFACQDKISTCPPPEKPTDEHWYYAPADTAEFCEENRGSDYYKIIETCARQWRKDTLDNGFYEEIKK